MKFIYPAVFRKTKTGTYKGYFPDLECCYAEGETLDDAIEKAKRAAAYDWISLELSRGRRRASLRVRQRGYGASGRGYRAEHFCKYPLL